MALGTPPFVDNSNGNPLLEEYNRTGVVPPALAPVIESVRRKMQALGSPEGGQLAPPQAAPPPLTSGVPRGTSQPAPAVSPMALSSPGSAPQSKEPFIGDKNWDQYAKWEYDKDELQKQHPEMSEADAEHILTSRHGAEVAKQPTPGAALSAGGNPTPAKDEYNRLVKTGSGIDQIHNPWARNSLHVLDAIGSMFAPALTAGLPGTQFHHNLLVRQAAGNVNEEQNVAKEEASTRDLNAQAAERENPAAKSKQITNEFEKWMADNPNGKLEDWEKFKADHLKAVQAATPFEKWAKDNPNGKVEDWLKLEQTLKPGAEKEGEMPLGERVPQINQALTARYQVLHPKQPLPPYYQLPANATQKDAERISNLLKDEEGAQGTKAQRDQAQQNHQETMAMIEANREHKDTTATKAAALKAYTPALDSAERFNVMAKNYEDAVKNHDQQAMLSLLANHLGMTMGLQKGARMNKDIIKEAEQSRPWLQGMQAKFDKDGYLSGVTLTPEQMRQMVNLGRERFAEDISKGRNEARYMGANDEGPERTPSKATINHYIGLANGDVTRAKQLAAADGWSVK